MKKPTMEWTSGDNTLLLLARGAKILDEAKMFEGALVIRAEINNLEHSAHALREEINNIDFFFDPIWHREISFGGAMELVKKHINVIELKEAA